MKTVIAFCLLALGLAGAQQPSRTDGEVSAQTSVTTREQNEMRGAGVIYPDARSLALLDDTYAVYSTVLANLDQFFSGHSAKDKVLLIDNQSGELPEDMDPARCESVPERYRLAFSDLLADYRAHQKDRVQIEPRLSINRPYKLLSDLETRQFVTKTLPWDKSIKVEKPSDATMRMFQATGVFTLGRVFFTHDHSMAMFSLYEWCGNVCAHGTWEILEKKSGKWKSLDYGNEIHGSCLLISSISDRQVKDDLLHYWR